MLNGLQNKFNCSKRVGIYTVSIPTSILCWKWFRSNFHSPSRKISFSKKYPELMASDLITVDSGINSLDRYMSVSVNELYVISSANSKWHKSSDPYLDSHNTTEHDKIWHLQWQQHRYPYAADTPCCHVERDWCFRVSIMSFEKYSRRRRRKTRGSWQWFYCQQFVMITNPLLSLFHLD